MPHEEKLQMCVVFTFQWNFEDICQTDKDD